MQIPNCEGACSYSSIHGAFASQPGTQIRPSDSTGRQPAANSDLWAVRRCGLHKGLWCTSPRDSSCLSLDWKREQTQKSLRLAGTRLTKPFGQLQSFLSSKLSCSPRAGEVCSEGEKLFVFSSPTKCNEGYDLFKRPYTYKYIYMYRGGGSAAWGYRWSSPGSLHLVSLKLFFFCWFCFLPFIKGSGLPVLLARLVFIKYRYNSIVSTFASLWSVPKFFFKDIH